MEGEEWERSAGAIHRVEDPLHAVDLGALIGEGVRRHLVDGVVHSAAVGGEEGWLPSSAVLPIAKR